MRIRFCVNLACCLIPFPRMRRYMRHSLRQCFNNEKCFRRYLSGRPVIVWFDHALGGGTETYSRRQFADLRDRFDIIRIQYYPGKLGGFKLTNPRNRDALWQMPDLSAFTEFCHTISVHQIVVNNLVIYADTPAMLRYIADLKQSLTTAPMVSFRGHDFYCICPSFNLINCEGNYCDLAYHGGCENCWAHRIMSPRAKDNAAFRSGVDSVAAWRKSWGQFFKDTVDEIILFSPAIEKIFTRVYPSVADKIKIIPHAVREYPRVEIIPHTDINIAVLGNVSHQKGAPVIYEMSRHLPPNVHIYIVGNMKNAPENIHVHGPYRPHKLPRIMSRYQVDVVLIPSIWPETFSYTTSEAMSMRLPVACYNMGAPAERVSNYEYGLVMGEIAPQKNLEEIINFVMKLRESKK